MSDCHICGREVSPAGAARFPVCTCADALNRAEELLRAISSSDVMRELDESLYWRDQISEVLTMIRE